MVGRRARPEAKNDGERKKNSLRQSFLFSFRPSPPSVHKNNNGYVLDPHVAPPRTYACSPSPQRWKRAREGRGPARAKAPTPDRSLRAAAAALADHPPGLASRHPRRRHCRTRPSPCARGLLIGVAIPSPGAPSFLTLPRRILSFLISTSGKVHGSLARAGKVRGQTPKVAKQDKKKTPKGRALKRLKYNRRFVNVGELKERRESGSGGAEIGSLLCGLAHALPSLFPQSSARARRRGPTRSEQQCMRGVRMGEGWARRA